jgi:hypothetical protein
MKDVSKQKPPERSLIFVMGVCFICGLIFLGLPVKFYLKGQTSLEVSPHLTSVSVSMYNSLADSGHWVMFDFIPTIGFIFLLIGYLILNAYRKIKLSKEKDNAETLASTEANTV